MTDQHATLPADVRATLGGGNPVCPDGICRHCRYFVHGSQCRRYPPSPEWASVQASDFCGEWVASEAYRDEHRTLSRQAEDLGTRVHPPMARPLMSLATLWDLIRGARREVDDD